MLTAAWALFHRVVEFIGEQHDPNACRADCAERHAFYFVRLPPSSSTAPRARWARRRLDLEADLQEESRVCSLEALLTMEQAQVADAWALLEPRDDEGDAEALQE
jgi:hypothetical protein